MKIQRDGKEYTLTAEPLFTDYVPDLIPVEEELNQESAAAGMTLEEYIKKEYLFK